MQESWHGWSDQAFEFVLHGYGLHKNHTERLGDAISCHDSLQVVDTSSVRFAKTIEDGELFVCFLADVIFVMYSVRKCLEMCNILDGIETFFSVTK